MLSLRSLVVVVVLLQWFLLNPQAHDISSCPIYISQIARQQQQQQQQQQQYLLFAFCYLKSLRILSNSFSNLVSMSRYDVTKF
jgi:hypothetical protein